MISVATKKPLRVEYAGKGHPLIDVPTSRLEDVRSLLDAHDVPYWVSATTIQWEGEPKMSMITLSYRADPAAVQRLLDQAS
jgi:hypothetical protein